MLSTSGWAMLWSHTLKKPDFLPGSSQLSLPPQFRVKVPEPLPTPYWTVDCLDLVKFLCKQAQLLAVGLWVRLSCHVEKTLLCSDPPWLLYFCPLFHSGTWSTVDVCVVCVCVCWYRHRCHICGWALHSYFHSILWPIVNLCINPCSQQREPSLTKAESSTSLWV